MAGVPPSPGYSPSLYHPKVLHRTDMKDLISEYKLTTDSETAVAWTLKEKRKRSRWRGWDLIQGVSLYTVMFPGLPPQLQGLSGDCLGVWGDYRRVRRPPATGGLKTRSGRPRLLWLCLFSCLISSSLSLWASFTSSFYGSFVLTLLSLGLLAFRTSKGVRIHPPHTTTTTTSRKNTVKIIQFLFPISQ